MTHGEPPDQLNMPALPHKLEYTNACCTMLRQHEVTVPLGADGGYADRRSERCNQEPTAQSGSRVCQEQRSWLYSGMCCQIYMCNGSGFLFFLFVFCPYYPYLACNIGLVLQHVLNHDMKQIWLFLFTGACLTAVWVLSMQSLSFLCVAAGKNANSERTC